MCCGIHEIKMNSFHCGHVLAVVNGGKTSVDNLRPICAACNLSMGTENLEDFKTRCGFNSNSSTTGSSNNTVINNVAEATPVVETKTAREIIAERAKARALEIGALKSTFIRTDNGTLIDTSKIINIR